MPWDIPDEGGSKGPEEPEDNMKVKKLYAITNLETDEKFLVNKDEVIDQKTGRRNLFFREIGRTDNN